MLTAHASSSAPPAPPSTGPVPRDVQGRIWAALAELIPRERVVLVLAGREQLDDDEIARLLTCSRRTVQSDGLHAAIVMREALARPFEAAPWDPTDPAQPHHESRPEPAPSMAGLESAIQATLAAHADDVRPPPGLADDARDRSELLGAKRRTRRLVGAGVALAVIGCAAGVAALTAPPRDDPTAAPSLSASPSADTFPGPGSSRSSSAFPIVDDPVSPAVFRMAAESDALVAVGHTIIDGTSSVEIPVNVQIDPDSGEAVVQTIDALARAAGGYVVLTGPYQQGARSGDLVLYVDRRGTVTPLGMSALSYGLVVSPDGLLVAYAEARDPGKPGVVAVRELSGQVRARREMDAVSIPVWLDQEGVWVSPQVDPGISPSYWNLATNLVDPLNVPTTEVLQAAHGPQLILDDPVGSGCTLALRAPSPRVPRELWSDCNVGTVRYSPTGELVALVLTPADTDVTVVSVRDARTGQVVAQRALLDRPLIESIRWTAGGQHLVATPADNATGERSVVTFSLVADTARLGMTRYPLSDGVVLGDELPLPPNAG